MVTTFPNLALRAWISLTKIPNTVCCRASSSGSRSKFPGCRTSHETRNPKPETSHRPAGADCRDGHHVYGRGCRCPLQQTGASDDVHVRLQPGAAGVQPCGLRLL